MITNFFIPELNNHDVQELWFQQDGATCHTARAAIDLLKNTFGDRLFSRFGPVNWPPRSCDLTPLDYFLWGYVKSLVYADKPQTLDHLKDNIRRVIADIRPQMLEKSHRKLDVQIGLHTSQPWKSYARNHLKCVELFPIIEWHLAMSSGLSIAGHRGNLKIYAEKKSNITCENDPTTKERIHKNSWSYGISGANEEITVSSSKIRYKKAAHVQKLRIVNF
ncbi:uncharacterized protein TNCV_236961 [Trichonephila clavipes]|nr:uncharacterized protein TNCV_236961 [Trichonephila clavipes]